MGKSLVKAYYKGEVPENVQNVVRKLNEATRLNELKAEKDKDPSLFFRPWEEKDQGIKVDLINLMQHFQKGDNIAIIADGSPFHNLLHKGQDIELKSLNREKPGISIIRAATVKKQQQNVQIWYDPTKITPQQVRHIMLLKAQRRIDKGELTEEFKALGITVINNKGEFHQALELYRKKLEELSSYYVIRGKTTQFYNQDGSLVNPPDGSDKILYYGTFPSLQRGTNDFNKYVKNGKLTTNPEKIVELRKKFEATLRLHIAIAAANNEGYDLLTPNAFFYGLNEGEDRLNAKRLFVEAVLNVVTGPCPQGFQGLFIHKEGGLWDALEVMGQNCQCPVVLTSHDSSAPARMGGMPIAEALMGDGLNPAGNKAYALKMNNAREEGETRKSIISVQATFNLNNNPALGIEKNYRPIQPSPLERKEGRLELKRKDDNRPRFETKSAIEPELTFQGTINDEDIRDIVKRLHNGTLTHLTITDCPLKGQDIELITTALRENSSLTRLTMQRCNIDANGAGHIAKALQETHTLIYLDISDNHIKNEGAIHLLTAIEANTALTTLNINIKSNDLQNNGDGLEGNFNYTGVQKGQGFHYQIDYEPGSKKEEEKGGGSKWADQRIHRTPSVTGVGKAAC